ncbi:methylated-DNA--[protein]-cysteine S-methyltransferase [Tissierella praeacuta]|uniref:methylated-DNA--[protein]-cysteine S-methyltransferase n=1 Tax=Tissierella praeacuta TaxID=43131 RepID=UPI0033428999
MNPKYYSFESPIGRLTIYFTEKGIISLSFKEEDKLKYMERYYDTPIKVDQKDYNYHEEITKYLKGELKEFTMPISFKGTPFQERVWNELLNIPYGKTKTYKELAEKIGCPRGSRAVGGALNKNPIAIIVPCHRVVGSNGNLVGFAGGVEVKDKLLKLEINNII